MDVYGTMTLGDSLEIRIATRLPRRRTSFATGRMTLIAIDLLVRSGRGLG